MISIQDIKRIAIAELRNKYPFVDGFFSDQSLEIDTNEQLSFSDFIRSFDDDEAEDRAIDFDTMENSLVEYINQMLSFLGDDIDSGVDSLTILPGTNKFGEKENFESLTIKKSEIVCIVGPTGSGKSRLLGDIEWVAQNDTPTSRSILINGEVSDKKWRLSSGNKLVAQLSQNMNFVMDLTVYEFLELHAQSRLVENIEDVIQRIIASANNLAGEKFELSTPITSLSGGQSRALMIADTAILSKSPIVLIDEIENAGIDRKKALELLVGEEKIVLMATHDPILALMGDRRIVIKNGGINMVLNTTDKERELLTELNEMDKVVQNLRHRIRNGEVITSVV